MSISDFLGLCHHNELEEGVGLATVCSSHPLPPFPSTRLCNYLCDVGHLQQKSLGEKPVPPPTRVLGKQSSPKAALLWFLSHKWVSPPTDQLGSVVLRSCALGIAASLQPPQTGAGFTRDFGHPPFACLTGFNVLVPGVFAPLTASPSANGALKRGLVFPNNLVL